VDQNKKISGQPLSHLSQTKVAILKTILFQQMTVDRIVNDQTEVAETFNEFFVNVGKDIGKDSCAVNQEHPRVKVISEHNYAENK
jgi:hypothetical protein